MKQYITQFGNWRLDESSEDSIPALHVLRVLAHGFSDKGVILLEAVINPEWLGDYDMYLKPAFIRLKGWLNWPVDGIPYSMYNSTREEMEDIDGFDSAIYTEEHYGHAEIDWLQRTHQRNLEALDGHIRSLFWKYVDSPKYRETFTDGAVLRIRIKETIIESENGGAPTEFRFPEQDIWLAVNDRGDLVEIEPLRASDYTAGAVDESSSNSSSAADDIITRIQMNRYGIGDGVKVIKAEVRWENLEHKNPFGGEPPFIIWQRYEKYPADLAQSKADEDSWVDYPGNIPGFMEAYGREGDTEIVDEFLLDEAYQHDAEVLWIAVDNTWRIVETGEYLPDLRKI